VVDYVSGNSIYAVEQNASLTGVHEYYYNDSNYTGGYGVIKAILHAPNNFFQNAVPVATALKYPKNKIYLSKGKNKSILFTAYGDKNGYGDILIKKTNSKIVTGIPSKKFIFYNKRTTLKVNAKKKGHFQITFTLPNGIQNAIQKTTDIYVYKKPKYLKKIKKINGVSKIALSKKSYYTFNLSPSNVTNLKYKWLTKGKKIKVDSSGMVTAIKKGITYLYLKVEKKTKKKKIIVY
jgi:hypothetical protein